jgi:hypothetical protein
MANLNEMDSLVVVGECRYGWAMATDGLRTNGCSVEKRVGLRAGILYVHEESALSGRSVSAV